MSAAVSGLFIRPPRSKYDRKSLGPRLQKLASWRGYPIIVRREDFQIRNRRNLNLECSLYVPVGRSDGKSHCILYCHGASGGKLDGITDVWEIGMQLEVALCVFDFAGCGKSQGEYITLGMWEEDDVRCIVKELVEKLGYKSVMLWGRSMGSVACIRAASRDPFEWIPPPPAPSDEEYRKWRIDELVNLILELEEDWEDGKSGIQSPKPSPTESHEKMFESDSSSEAKVKRVGTGTCAARSMDLGSMEKAELITRVQELTTKIRDREAINKKVGFMRVVSCVVADSPFGNLWNASRHIIEHYKSVVPQFMLRGLASVGLPIVRKSILKKIPEFDIKKLDCVSGAAHCRVPAIIMHAVNDTLIPWEESRQVYEAWGTKVFASSGARSRLSSKEISNQKTLQSRNPSNPPNTPRSKSPQARVAAAAGASGGREEPGLETPSQNRRLETAVPSEDMKEEKTKKDEDRGSGREEEKGEEAKAGHKPPLNLTKEMLDKRRKDSLGILNSHNGQGGRGSDLDAPFRTTNRRAESPANLPSPLRSPKERMATKEENPNRVGKQYVLIDGDHNSLRPATYYDSIARFLIKHGRGENEEEEEEEEEDAVKGISIPAIVPSHIKGKGDMRFFYGVAVISEYTDEEVTLKKDGDAPRDERAASNSSLVEPSVRSRKSSRQSIERSSNSNDGSRRDSGASNPDGDDLQSKLEKNRASDPLDENEEEPNEESKAPQTLAEYVANGVSCTVRTVSFSWRMVLGLHPKRGILVFRPYSGITLYAITFAELLSFHMASPAQLRFMFLDESKTQRRVRFYSPEVPTLKDHIDRAIRKLVSHDHMTTIELMAKITKNLAGASAAIVEKRLLSARGLTIAEVGDIIESLNSAIESMLGERPEDELPEGVEPEDMVIKAVLHAVEVRTGWRPDISKLAKSKKKQKNRKGNRCAIS